MKHNTPLHEDGTKELAGSNSRSFSRFGMPLGIRKIPLPACIVLLALVGLNVGCKNADKPSYKVFATPDDAGNALLQAAKSGDQNQLLEIFGPDSKGIISSGDPVQDNAAMDAYVQGYGKMHRWRKMPDGAQALLIGADNFEFPIPLKKTVSGQWYFDAVAGKEEILRRRVGRNELAVIDICSALVRAQFEYFSQPRDGAAKQFAQKFISDPGKHNGLYWDSPAGQPQSPLGPLAAFATADGYAVKQDWYAPFHGYFFRILNKQTNNAPGGAKDYITDGKMVGGFAFVAYPAEYGNTGVMTFIINQDGVLLQKDLGKSSKAAATAMTALDPDNTWNIVRG
jgi:Protein of unknown function (DUF2950)